MTADHDFVVRDERGGIDRGAIAEKRIETSIGRAVGINARQAIGSGPVVILEPAGKQNLPVREDFDMTAPAIDAAAHVKASVERTVGIQAADSCSGRAVVRSKTAGHENFFV